MDEMIEYYGEYITEDSVIRTVHGLEMKGKYEVSKGILECCMTYHDEQMRKLKIEATGAVLGVVACVGIYKIVKSQIEKHKDKK